MRSRDIEAADDRFDLVERRRQQHRFGDISTTPIVASWHEPGDCFREGRGAGRAIAMPRTEESRRARRDGCIPGVMRKPARAS
jgi:hypothetical protein